MKNKQFHTGIVLVAIFLTAPKNCFGADDGARKLSRYGDFKPANESNVRRDHIYPVGDFGPDFGAVNLRRPMTNSTDYPFIEKPLDSKPVSSDPDPVSMKSAWELWRNSLESAVCEQFGLLADRDAKQGTELNCEIVYTVTHDGKVSEVGVLRGSGDSLFDNRVRAALIVLSYKPPVQFPQGSRRSFVRKSTFFNKVAQPNCHLAAKPGKIDEPPPAPRAVWLKFEQGGKPHAK